MRRKTLFRYLVFAILTSAALIFQYFRTNQSVPLLNNTKPTISSKPEVKNVEKAYVVNVIDGDTIIINNGKRVRYIGVDAPEIKHKANDKEDCFGREAYLKNKELVEKKNIYLEKDVSDVDKYGRLLRYVYLNDPHATGEAVLLNQNLVGLGYALVSTYPPDVKYTDLFLQAQKEARDKRLGLWGKCL